MSKHFSIFQTAAQFDAAKDSLDYPHVSLIDTTGDLHYYKYNGKEIADAGFGDILICEKSTGLHFYVTCDDYNDTDYNNSQYIPLGVCIYDKASNPNNQAVFMLYNNTLYSFIYSAGQYKFAQNRLTDDDLVYTSKNNNVSSININNYFRNKLTETEPDINLESTSVSTCLNTKQTIEKYNYPAIYAVSHMYGYGFEKGDLLIPSYNDIYKAFDTTVDNQHIIGASFSKIGVTPNFGFMTCTSHTYNPKINVYAMDGNNWGTNSTKVNLTYKAIDLLGNSYSYVRPVFITGIEEV